MTTSEKLKLVLIVALLTVFQFVLFSQDEKLEIKETKTNKPQNKKKISLRDPQTGAIDISDLIYNAKGFIPIPFVITEPAVGYGGGLAILYFQPQKKDFLSDMVKQMILSI